MTRSKTVPWVRHRGEVEQGKTEKGRTQRPGMPHILGFLLSAVGANEHAPAGRVAKGREAIEEMRQQCRVRTVARAQRETEGLEWIEFGGVALKTVS